MPGSSPAVAWRIGATLEIGDIDDFRALTVVDGDVLLSYDSCDVVAIDARTGRARWTVGTRSANQFWHRYAKVDRNLVFGGGAVIDPASGRLLEERQKGKSYALFGRRGVRAERGKIEILDLASGRVRAFAAPWAGIPVPQRSPGLALPVIEGPPATAGGVVVLWRSRAVYGFDAGSGGLRWRVPIAGGPGISGVTAATDAVSC